MFLMVSILW